MNSPYEMSINQGKMLICSKNKLLLVLFIVFEQIHGTKAIEN